MNEKRDKFIKEELQASPTLKCKFNFLAALT
jgi:hypothetical protein